VKKVLSYLLKNKQTGHEALRQEDSTLTKLRAVMAAIVEKVRELVECEFAKLDDTLEEGGLAAIEARLELLRDGVSLALLEGIGKALGNGRRTNRLPCECGGQLVYVADRRKDVLTTLGWLTLHRAYFRCKRCKASRFPLDEELGIVGEGQSTGVQLMVSLVCALLPNGQAMRLLDELKLPSVSIKESQRITRDVGTEAVALCEETARQWSEDHTPPTDHVRSHPPERLAVLMDGTTAHTDGDWHEVKVGTFYTFDKEGKATGEKACVSTFERVEHFRSLWDTEAQRWHMADARHVVALCDGAPWTWNTIAEYCPPHTVELLDFYHATEHLWEMARALWGEGAPRAKEWVEQQKTRLLEGDIEPFFTELTRWTEHDATADAAQKQLRYFEANRTRLGYAGARARGEPIGSGMVEAACKTIVCLREKQPGMRWTKTNANVIAHLRCLYFSERWDSFKWHMTTRARKVA
jgi:hypothetical protein